MLNATESYIIRFRRVFYLNNFVVFLWWTQMTEREDPGRQKRGEAVQVC